MVHGITAWAIFHFGKQSSGYSVGTQKGSSGYSPGIPVSGNAGSTTLRLFASAAIGAGAAKLVGGNAKIGAISAYNGTKYNDLIHHPTTPGAIVYSDGNPPNHEGRGYYEVQSDGSESYLPDGIKPGDVVWYPNGEYNDNGQQMGNEHIIGDDGKPIAIQWVATQVPVGSSALLQSFVTVYRAVNQETHEDVIVNGGTPMKDGSGTIYNQAVSDYENNTAVIQIAAGFVNPGASVKVTIAGSQIGKKLVDHAADYGLTLSREGASAYKEITQRVLQNATEIRVGNWKTLGECEFYITDVDVAIVKNGEWVSTFPLTNPGTIEYIKSLVVK